MANEQAKPDPKPLTGSDADDSVTKATEAIKKAAGAKPTTDKPDVPPADSEKFEFPEGNIRRKVVESDTEWFDSLINDETFKTFIEKKFKLGN